MEIAEQLLERELEESVVSSELSTVRIDVFEVMPFIMEEFEEFKSQTADEYAGCFYAILPSLDNALIDEEGLLMLAGIADLPSTKTTQIVKEFKATSVMGEMSFEQFMMLASKHNNTLTTKDILAKHPAIAKLSLEQVVDRWRELKKEQAAKLTIEPTKFNFYVKNVVEKLDTLEALLLTDSTTEEHSDELNYLAFLEANAD